MRAAALRVQLLFYGLSTNDSLLALAATLIFGGNGYDKRNGNERGCFHEMGILGTLIRNQISSRLFVRQMENDWWVYGYECPQEIEVFKSRKGRFGVRFFPYRYRLDLLLNHIVY